MRQKIMYKLMIVLVLVAMLMAACAPKATTTGGDEDPLVAAAKAEGQLTTIALPHDWCNYGEAIEVFKAKYGLTVNELNPDAGSGDEIEAIKANKDSKGPQAPDVIDIARAADHHGKLQPPIIKINGVATDMDIGLSHDGRFMAYCLLYGAKLQGYI